MYSTSEDPLFDGLNCLKIYLQKLNPKSEALFQYPKRAMAIKLEDPVCCLHSCYVSSFWRKRSLMAQPVLVENIRRSREDMGLDPYPEPTGMLVGDVKFV
ncbi:hypothetical protein OS493_011494 [Desmophyllum pertusum]|uniref:Uncharacterized protein n=1 Tax=Desmophyllum pertusum TaxID=174260 RepID=A0A9W9YTE7_9CNID|nr:hypothetical protein OS493_011494 [Desmophyllum pertusum]